MASGVVLQALPQVFSAMRDGDRFLVVLWSCAGLAGLATHFQIEGTKGLPGR